MYEGQCTKDKEKRHPFGCRFSYIVHIINYSRYCYPVVSQTEILVFECCFQLCYMLSQGRVKLQLVLNDSN